MAQPQWITPAGSLGTVPEGVYYQQDLLASTDVVGTATVLSASSITNRFTCVSTSQLYAGMNVMFTAPNDAVFGGVNTATRYFILEVYNSTEFSISATEFSTTALPLVTETGSMTANATQHVYYRLIAGELPPGVQVSDNGMIMGVPKAVASIQGVPLPVNADITYKFAVRGYTTVPSNPSTIDRISDRTFTITVTGQDVPDFITPEGLLGVYYDGTPVTIPIQFTDSDPGDQVRIGVTNGELPPGLTIDPITGIISGAIKPLVGVTTGIPGYDNSQYSEFPWDFGTRSASKSYQFTLEITDGKDANLRTYEIFVYSKDSMTADTTDFTADNDWITADIVPVRTPVLLTPEGDLGRVRADNFHAFKFDAIDFDEDVIEYSITTGAGVGFDEALFDETDIGFDRGGFSLPPGLTINPTTGWFYGYIPDQGASEQTYRFAVRVFKQNQPSVISGFYYFTITIIGNIDAEVTWLTEEDLGTINNGDVSLLYVKATNNAGRVLQYRLESGSNSKLPQGLRLLSSGNIVGKVSFNTFTLDSGTTTFDNKYYTRRTNGFGTTIDSTYNFTVNAYSTETEQYGYQINSFVILNGGTSYVSQPTVTISAPPATATSIQATAGAVTIVNGEITAIAIGNPGRGYTSPPTITITGGGGSDAVVVAQMVESELTNAVSVFRRFKIRVNRKFQTPYQSLYVKCMPPLQDRQLVTSLLQNRDIIPNEFIYRSDDENFGIAKNIVYPHAYGLTVKSLEDYVNALSENHYWKHISLGEIKTARAVDATGNVVYEVVYSTIVDDLVNNQNISISKQINWPYPINYHSQIDVTTVYPNSLDNMRTQVISQIGQITPGLPLWMTSKQENGTVLGFVPSWVIAYTQPGKSAQLAYNIRKQFGDQLNLVDFTIDRYELDCSQTNDWNIQTNKWNPQPPGATTFDTVTAPSLLVGWKNSSNNVVNWENDDETVVFWKTPPTGITQQGTRFDGNSTRFITPTAKPASDDRYNKYLVFPKVNILE